MNRITFDVLVVTHQFWNKIFFHALHICNTKKDSDQLVGFFDVFDVNFMTSCP
jgi:hypothetical protein